MRRAQLKPVIKIREDTLRNSITFSLTACSLAIAVSSAASAADIAAGTYSVNGFTTSSNCTIPGSPQKGQPSTATIVYPGAGKTGMILANPPPPAKSAAGKGVTQVCVASGKVPATGLNKATIPFTCYDDTEAGPSK